LSPIEKSEVRIEGLRYLTGLWRAVVVISTGAAAGAIIVYAVVVSRTVPPTRGAYLLLLIGLLALTFTLFLDRLRKSGRLAVESHWGGLGGGLSGWRVSDTLTFLLLSIGLFALLVIAIGGETPGPDLLERYILDRYRTALNLAGQNGIKFERREMVGRKLLLKGTAPSQAAANQFWDQVKLANPIYDDVTPDISITAPTPAGASGAKGAAR
jgi:hypothetical protein